MSKLLAAALALWAVPAMAQQKVESETRPMKFEACLQSIRTISAQLGIVPVNLTETNDIRMVRFRTSDGSVLVTCSRPDQKMVLTRSPHR